MSAIQFTTVIGPDGVIRPPVGVKLPEGQIQVAVQSCAAQRPDSDSPGLTYGWLLALAAEAERDAPSLPADMAENHDRYAHGKPNS